MLPREARHQHVRPLTLFVTPFILNSTVVPQSIGTHDEFQASNPLVSQDDDAEFSKPESDEDHQKKVSEIDEILFISVNSVRWVANRGRIWGWRFSMVPNMLFQ